MNIKSSVELKYKRGNRLFFSRDSDCLFGLIRLIEQQRHRTLVMWAFECAQKSLSTFEAKYPHEPRPRKAVELSTSWARGTCKMPEAKRAIMGAHAVAKGIDDREYGAVAHAIGHACATVHVETHAVGLVCYELTAIVLAAGLDQCDAAVADKIKHYHNRLLYWQENIDSLDAPWASFLADDSRPNKEKALNEKRRRGGVCNPCGKGIIPRCVPIALFSSLPCTPLARSRKRKAGHSAPRALK